MGERSGMQKKPIRAALALALHLATGAYCWRISV
jgi:hypothetical protein